MTAEYDSDPKWSPDGTEIVFTRMTSLPHRDARNDVYVFAPGGSGLRRLTMPRMKKSWDPAWSPDGKLIAFVGYREVTPRYPTRPRSMSLLPTAAHYGG